MGSEVCIRDGCEAAASHLAGVAVVPSITAGLTDAGVHALAQVAHLDFPAHAKLTRHAVREGLSFHLRPHAVVALDAAPVGPDWNARFSATWRSYEYRILNRRARPALAEGHVWHVKSPLDIARMQDGANHLVGAHDFTSFRAAACQANSPLRTLDDLRIRREGDHVLVSTRARSFLHHQVRNMVGTLKLVGIGQWEPERVAHALRARTRAAAGPPPRPEGFNRNGWDSTPAGLPGAYRRRCRKGHASNNPRLSALSHCSRGFSAWRHP